MHGASQGPIFHMREKNIGRRGENMHVFWDWDIIQDGQEKQQVPPPENVRQRIERAYA